MGNKSDFGGVSIAVIRDLYQLRPVFDRSLFDSLETPYGPLPCNLWNKHFRMFEPQEITSQKEGNFSKDSQSSQRRPAHQENL